MKTLTVTEWARENAHRYGYERHTAEGLAAIIHRNRDYIPGIRRRGAKRWYVERESSLIPFLDAWFQNAEYEPPETEPDALKARVADLEAQNAELLGTICAVFDDLKTLPDRVDPGQTCLWVEAVNSAYATLRDCLVKEGKL